MGLDSEQKSHGEISAEKKSREAIRAKVEVLEARRLLDAAPGAPNYIAFGVTRTPGTGSDPVDIQQGYLIDNNTSELPDLVTTNSNGKVNNIINTISVFIGKIDNDGFYDVNGQEQYYSGGINPQGVAIGDLNGATDGTDYNYNYATGTYTGFPVSELVVANADEIGESTPFLNYLNAPQYVGGGGIAILFGNMDLKNNVAYADGAFYDSYAPPKNQPNPPVTTMEGFDLGGQPEKVQIGDLNGDGVPDIVVTNEAYGLVDVLIGAPTNNVNYSGGSTVAVGGYASLEFSLYTYAVGTEPIGLTLADLNGADYPGTSIPELDIVTTNSHDSDVSVLMNNGDGTFQPQVTYAVGNKPVALTTGDLTGDGHLDLIVANYDSNTISVLVNNADGTFQPQITYAVGTTPTGVAVDEVTEVNIEDVAVSNAGDNDIGVLVGNGDGTFEPMQTFGTGTFPLGITAVDEQYQTFNYVGTTLTTQMETINIGFATTNFDSSSASILISTRPAFAYYTGAAPNETLYVNGDGQNDSLSITVNLGIITATLQEEVGAGTFGQPYVSTDNLDYNAPGAPFLEANISQISVTGYDGNDLITIGARLPQAVVVGGPGNDTIIALNDVSDTLVGQAGADSITAVNLAGDDLMNGGQGSDTIVAGTGNCTLHGQKGLDSLVGGPGDDQLIGGGGSDTIVGSVAVGDNGSSLLAGGPGSDSIVGGPDDTLSGGAGVPDTIVIESP
ncbi:MAG TPA: FG-GAP-like repeat-containing protein [Tepidisphaeraceae bacterium]|nr:FG-GAP-like repeat-containing protein [Tepidisphaeraceae bacterium]